MVELMNETTNAYLTIKLNCAIFFKLGKVNQCWCFVNSNSNMQLLSF